MIPSEITPNNDVGLVAAKDNEPIFFPVSIVKLVLLSICSFGLYEVYWFAKNWQLIKKRERSNIRPVWRAIFAIFFCYALFRKVDEAAKVSGISSIPSSLLAISWIVINLLSQLPDPFWFISFLSVLCLVQIQRTVNHINMLHAPSHNPNSDFSGWNILLVVVGSILFVLSAIGVFLYPK